jgi:ATP-dependent Clp protease ATP-binding subunit ClpB
MEVNRSSLALADWLSSSGTRYAQRGGRGAGPRGRRSLQLDRSATVLDPSRQCAEAEDFEQQLRSRIIGQDRAIRQLTRVYQVYLAGLSAPGRPLANLLLLGPTGSGKTRLVEAAAEALFGDSRAVVKVDCSEFQHSHEIAKLVGSPPGYLGHRETHPMITQEVLEKNYTENVKISLVLFDEIEKASDSLWQLLLGILDKGTLTLGDNRRVDFSRSLIFLTSNLGSQEMTKLMSGGLGYMARPLEEDAELDQKIYRTAVDAARRKFSPEFMNRIDKAIVFRTLKRDHLETILDIELRNVERRIASAAPGQQFEFQCTGAARDFLLQEGTDSKYGARHLKRAIERHLVFPLANLVATSQVGTGDGITIDHNPATSKLTFLRESSRGWVGSEVQPALEHFWLRMAPHQQKWIEAHVRWGAAPPGRRAWYFKERLNARLLAPAEGLEDDLQESGEGGHHASSECR